MRSLNLPEQGMWIFNGMDPYIGKGNYSKQFRKLYFNLGEISEDVLKDGRKQYENGLGPDQILVNPRPIWGDVPASQSLIYAFDTNANNRSNQDVGLTDCLTLMKGSVY
jgi:cell surface protein SprA